MNAFNPHLEQRRLRPREHPMQGEALWRDTRCVQSRLENRVLTWLALSNMTQEQSPTLSMLEPTSTHGRTGLFGKGPVEAGWSLSSTLECSKKRRNLLPFVNSSQIVRGDSTVTGRKAWPRCPTQDSAIINVVPPGERSLSWTLAIVSFLSFVWDTRIEIGAFFFTLPFPLFIILKHLMLQ